MQHRMLLSLIGAAAVAGCGSGGAGPAAVLLTPREFTQRYCEKLRQSAPGISVTGTGDLELKLISPGNKREHNVFLDNAYGEYQLAPESLKEVLERFVLASIDTLQQPESDVIDTHRIVPVIKDASYPEDMRASLVERGYDADKMDFYFERLNADLLVYYAIDSDKNLRYLRGDEIEALGLKPDELRHLAVENLPNLLPKIERRGTAGVYMVTAGGTYEASLLLLDSLWTGETFEVDGDVVTAVPSRDLLLVTGSNDGDGIARIRQICAEQLTKGSYQISEQLFVRRDGKWERFGGE